MTRDSGTTSKKGKRSNTCPRPYHYTTEPPTTLPSAMCAADNNVEMTCVRSRLNNTNHLLHVTATGWIGTISTT